jgi:hypothetical protein
MIVQFIIDITSIFFGEKYKLINHFTIIDIDINKC